MLRVIHVIKATETVAVFSSVGRAPAPCVEATVLAAVLSLY